MSNEYGLDYEYFERKLKLVIRDAKMYTPDEMMRELSRLAYVAENQDKKRDHKNLGLG